MDDDFASDEQPPRRFRIGRQTALLLAALAFAALARGYLAMVPGIRAARRISGDFGYGEAAVLSLVAIAASVIAVLVGRKYVNRPTAWLLAIAAGGLATATHDSFLGAFVGGATALVMVSRSVRLLMVRGLVALLAMAVGTVPGTLALWLDPDLSDGPSAATLAALAAAVLCGAVVLLWPTRHRRAAGWRRAFDRGAALLLLGIAGFWPSLTVDMARRVNHLAGDAKVNVDWFNGYWPETQLTVRPWSAELLWPGPLAVESLTVANDVTDDDLRALRGWKELQALAIVSDRVTDDGLANLEGLASLNALSITSDRITDAGMDHLIQLTGIRWLRLHRAQISGRGLDLLSQWLSLWMLSLDDTSVGDDDLALLAAFSGLRTLSLKGTRITDGAMESLSDIPSLMQLQLARTEITDRGLNVLSRLPNLSSLDVSGTRVTGEGAGEIDPASRLRDLDLAGAPVTDRGLGRLTAFDKLAGLNLTDTAITDGGLQQIARFPLLQLLHLDGTRTTDSGLATLQYCSQVRHLSVRRTHVTEEGVAEFRRASPECLLFGIDK